MKSLLPQQLNRTLLIFCGGAVLVLGSGLACSIYIEHKIDEKIRSLNGSTASIEVNLFTRSVRVKELAWCASPYSLNTQPHELKVSTLTVSGISIYKLVFNKILTANEVIFDNGKLQYNKSSIEHFQKFSNSKYRGFKIKNISLVNIETQIKTDTLVSFSALLNCHLTDATLEIDSIDSIRYSVKAIDGLAEKINVSRQEGFYGGTIARLQLNTSAQKLTIDSLLLIPNFTKYDFAHRFGKQTDRVSLSIPQLLIEGIQFDKIVDSSFVASKMEIKSFDVVAFRDKRIPDRNETYVPLPMESLLALPCQIKVDSILITKSFITIEEVSEKGTASGVVTFEDVNATLTGLNNRITETDQDYALLNASGYLMGAGKVTALFRLPLDGSSTYNAKGSLSKMPFKKLNAALVPLANVQIESGQLNNLTFNFNYTDLTSKGTLDLAYQDLQLLALDKLDHSANDIKTFLLNALVNNHRAKSLSSTGKGVIDIERDRKRFIFNIWWKSIRDGLKSILLASNN